MSKTTKTNAEMVEDPLPFPHEEFLVVVGWADGREPFVLHNRISADTGLALPVPPLTNAEMQTVAFAAKSALLRALHARKEQT